MKTINIPHKISAYAKTDERAQPDLTVWTKKRKAEWAKVTRTLHSALNNLDHDIYICCYSSATGYMTTKPEREGNDK
jgi:hypothetical protein